VHGGEVRYVDAAQGGGQRELIGRARDVAGTVDRELVVRRAVSPFIEGRDRITGMAASGLTGE